ncbi:SDR family NAD(P)-dependent oxidoreductase [Immundisolibacter sp.]|uniref:SDR family NAD(P)-dependent oxidoreductase n=1 Tax=Immundisolibacter sp. TaxID=1934948 RepID=UPI0019866C70|nr:SDR family NAD(P)-dependent oxidoreductase [Immundisolibacter sp.]MBC7162657.1 SDR family NAD(P)-dependent oxidoreductase [Immundisolibacter sp.]MEA3220605.1 Sepiapterin reductase [Immundisolibacter sp.]
MSTWPTALIVGAGPGLGLSLARRFGREGYAVAMVARRQAVLAELAAQLDSLGPRLKTYAADATDPAAVGEVCAATLRDLGEPSVLIYNAGSYLPGGIADITPEQFEAAWKTGCMGAFLFARALLPAMADAGRGTVLLTGATAALRGGKGFAALAVPKFGLRALAQSMAREYGPQGVHVAHVVIDGQIDTPRLRERDPDRSAHTLLAPDAIAETYWQLHCQDATAWTQELDLRPSLERF